MNEAHFHLVANHLPIIVPISGLIVFLIGIFTRSEVVKRSAYFLFVVGAISTMPAFVSGEGAEEVVEELGGISHHLIHEHEEKAELFAMLSYGLGLLSLIALWASWKKKQFASILGGVILIYSLVVLYMGKQTGTSGGEIRHTEIQTNGSSNGEHHEEHDED